MRHLSLVICFLIYSCAEHVSVTISEHGVSDTFTLLMQEAIDNSYSSIDGIALSISSIDKNIIWTGALGYDGRDKSKSVTEDQPFRIASVTKTFVATAILRLHEMDSLNIEEPISSYISTAHQEILREDAYDPDEITISHCLHHTAGLYDYAMGGSPYVKVVQENPQKKWSRTEQLEFAVEHGDKVGEPGERYAYCDTGYILLGEIIEGFFAGDLAQGLRSLIDFDGLGMSDTYLESLEEHPSDKRRQVRRYLGRLDALQYDASTDLYGGGGLVSTVKDLRIFMQSLFNHQIYDQELTLELMLQKPEFDPSYDSFEDKRFKDYRRGLWQIHLMGHAAYIHSGLWGTHLIYQPRHKTTLAINFTRGGSDRLIKKLFMAVNQAEEQ